jgi:hypothetical protein
METPEQAERAQCQMEDFARLAHNVKRAVERLEEEFCGLADWPEDIGEKMPQLAATANFVADAALDWARMCNTDFDPGDHGALELRGGVPGRR